jgi:hypothetical protein
MQNYTLNSNVGQCKFSLTKTHKCKSGEMIYKYGHPLSSHAFSMTQLLLRKKCISHKILHDLYIYCSTCIHYFSSLKMHVCVEDSPYYSKPKPSGCFLTHSVRASILQVDPIFSAIFALC